MQRRAAQCSKVQHSAVYCTYCSEEQCSAVKFSAVKRIQSSTVQCIEVQCNAVQQKKRAANTCSALSYCKGGEYLSAKPLPVWEAGGGVGV